MTISRVECFLKQRCESDAKNEIEIIHPLSSLILTVPRKMTGSTTVSFLRNSCFLIFPLLFTFHLRDNSAQGLLKTEDYSCESCNCLINANTHPRGSHLN